MDKRKGPTGSLDYATFYSNKPRKTVDADQSSRAKRSFDCLGGRIAMTVIVENQPVKDRETQIMLTSPMDKAAIAANVMGYGTWHGRVDFKVYGDRERVALAAAMRWAADQLDPHHTKVYEKEISNSDPSLPPGLCNKLTGKE